MLDPNLFLTDAQLAAEIARCEFCEEKPCKKACPVDCSPADFIKAMEQGLPSDISRAAALIMTRNPLGGICGAVCPDTHCKAACSRQGFDRPVEIPSIQAAIVARAKASGRMPKLATPEPNGKKVAVVGAGPAGLASAFTLAQAGYQVEVLERDSRPGGACALIPPHRLDPEVFRSDMDFLLGNPNIKLLLNNESRSPADLLTKGYDGVVIAAGLHKAIQLGIPGEDLALTANAYLRHPEDHPTTGRVAVIGGGAIACDCAVVAQLAGAESVEMVTLETSGEMPLTSHEMQLVLDHGIEVTSRTRVASIEVAGPSKALTFQKVKLAPGKEFHPSLVSTVPNAEFRRDGYDLVIIAIGNRPTLVAPENRRIVIAGDMQLGPSTVVEAVASGKNAAVALDGRLSERSWQAPKKANKSTVVIPGYDFLPVSLKTEFFGIPIQSPFLLSAAPPTDGYEQMKKALDAGWAGGVMKTSFDGLPIHIPAEYMEVFNQDTYGNCDNVSGHALSRVCKEIGALRREYPDRLIAASTGGPVTGHDDVDKMGWQHNSRLLEDAGAMAVEFSLSCPQGGDGTEGDIVAQSPTMTAKIVDWVMETSRPEIPKLFKLTGAVTSIAVILEAVKEVLDRYPDKKAGVTLANTFPTLGFRREKGNEWDQGIVFGMSGAGVAPISNLTLANVAGMGVKVSGNGGPMDYLAAADFLALGAETVQFCTVATKYGVGIIEDLHMGLSHLMAQRGIASVNELIGRALPNPIDDFMALTPKKGISQVDNDLCVQCGNCTRCPYLAITMGADGYPVTDASKCIGCSICAKKCFAGAITIRERTPKELSVLVEA